MNNTGDNELCQFLLMFDLLQFNFLFYKLSCVMGKMTEGRKLAYQFHFDVFHSEVLHQSGLVPGDLIPSNNISLIKRHHCYQCLPESLKQCDVPLQYSADAVIT